MWILAIMGLALGWAAGGSLLYGVALASGILALIAWHEASAARAEAKKAVKDAETAREIALRRVSELTARMHALEQRAATPPAPAEAAPPDERVFASAALLVTEPPPPAPADAPLESPLEPSPASPLEPAPARTPAPLPASAQVTARIDLEAEAHAREQARQREIEQHLRRLFIGDNPVARAGVLVLLIGIVLVLRLAAQHDLFPIEARLACVALGGAGLTVFGYRQRRERVTFARLLQGAGIATLYLVTFFAFRTFQLLPATLTFGLLVAVVIASGVLAVVQDALALVFVGTVGGFAAPILASSGGGNHVALFSYYLVLNALVLGVAWFKDWRLLTVTGFVATFGVGTAWGVLRYAPALFASTEPFLIAFFAIYVATNFVSALRRPEALRGGLSSSLTFGLPLATIGLQTALAGERDWLVAVSALVMALLYYTLARLLKARDPVALRVLVDGHLALAVGLATLAVPFALDSQAMVSATWVLEAAGLYWVGVRSERRLLRVASVLLVFAGVVAAGREGVWRHLAGDTLPVLNATSLCTLLLIAAVLFIATQARRAAAIGARERTTMQLLLIPAIALGAKALALEVDARVFAIAPSLAWLALASLCAAPLALFGARFDLPAARWLALSTLLAAAGLLLFERLGVQPVWQRGGALCWPVAVLGNALVLHFQGAHREAPVRVAHVLFPAWGAALLLSAAWDLVARSFALSSGWSDAALGLGLIVLLVAVDQVRRLPREPFQSFAPEYRLLSQLFVAALLAYWLIMLGRPGVSLPLPFLPLLNPLELVLIGALLLLVQRARDHVAALSDAERRDWLPGLPLSLVALAFAGVNATLGRAVHHFAGVDYALEALWRNDAFQVGLSVLWALLGLCGAFWASRRVQREVWFGAGALLFIVVAKLFLVDLARVGQLSRILSFLAVGALLLAVGYLAPLPPAKAAARGGENP
jgi:uncharacterized membrane protein